jgi:hypothetical protein
LSQLLIITLAVCPNFSSALIWSVYWTYRLHLQQSHLLSRWFLARLIVRPWRWRRYVPPKCRLTFNGLSYIPEDSTLQIVILIFSQVNNWFCNPS